jgi:hypothetical protein
MKGFHTDKPSQNVVLFRVRLGRFWKALKGNELGNKGSSERAALLCKNPVELPIPSSGCSLCGKSSECTYLPKMDFPLASTLLDTARSRYNEYKALGERALTQCSDDALTRVISPGSNSIAVIVHHLSGNLCSRWTDFLTTDGEKPNRNRDEEFAEVPVTRDTLFQWWEEGWSVCLGTLSNLAPDDLTQTITIRGQPLSVVDALYRNLAHTSYHVGQIVLLSKVFAGNDWNTLSIPRGGSDAYTQQLKQR